MSIKNSWNHLGDIMHETTAPNQQCVRVERALAITVVVVLLLAVCTFARVGAFASFEYSHIIGFSCIGISAFIALVKGSLLSLKCCESYIKFRSNNSFAVGEVTITKEDLKYAHPSPHFSHFL
jgi:hypothetical protein